MITAEREILVRCGQDEAWKFVQNMSNWANQMPGYMKHEEVGPDDSVWFLNVHMGPFSRPVEVHVKVQQWLPGEGAEFTLKAPYEPFLGEGSFRLTPAPQGTLVRMSLGTQITGSMLQVLTAMAVPVLNKVADEFAHNLQMALGGAPDDVAGSARSCAAPSSTPRSDATSWQQALRRWWRAFRPRIKKQER